jgi:hypothetical protein
MQQKTSFSMGSMPRSYKMAQSEDGKEHRTVVGRELGRVLENAVEGASDELAGKELDCADFMCELK